MTRLLVSGGAGFIGSNFVRYWAQRHSDDTIVVLDVLTYAGDRRNLDEAAALLGDRLVFVRGDIADAATVEAVFAEHSPRIVVNFAAESHNSRGVLDPTRFMMTNAVGTAVLLGAARRAGVDRFHHVSTCEVYGDLPPSPDAPAFSESSPYRPNTPYSASKAAADLAVRAFHSTFGLPVTISNSANTYGPYQHPEKVIPLFVLSAMTDSPLPLYRNSQNRREWMHVDDHCSGIAAVIERGSVGETYNIGTGDERSIEQVADAILDALRKPASLKSYVDDRPGHDRRYLLDHSKIERELGWRPAVSFADGLAATVAWYERNRKWWEPKRAALATQLDETGWRRR